MKIFRWLGLTFLAVAILVSLSPSIAYVIALDRVDGRPIAADPASYTPASVEAALRLCREPSPLSVQALNPWLFVLRIYNMDSRRPPGERAASLIARRFNAGMPNNAKMIWWHFSNAALTIWITRNWTSDQIGATVVRDGLCEPRSLRRT